jgi:hypothetical protein
VFKVLKLQAEANPNDTLKLNRPMYKQVLESGMLGELGRDANGTIR